MKPTGRARIVLQKLISNHSYRLGVRDQRSARARRDTSYLDGILANRSSPFSQTWKQTIDFEKTQQELRTLSKFSSDGAGIATIMVIDVCPHRVKMVNHLPGK